MPVSRVLHLIDSAGLYGAERVILTLLHELRNTEYPGILGCIRERENEIPDIAAEAKRLGIQIAYFTMRRGLNPFGIREICKFIKENSIPIVHSHGYKPNIFIGLLANGKVRRVSTVHGWGKNAAGIKGKAYEFFDAQALKRFDMVVAVSKAVVNDLTERGVGENKIKLIYNGLKIKNEKPFFDALSTRRRYGIDDDAFLIGTVGRLAEVKGHDYLIEAMPYILNEIKNCRLIIAGEGPARGYLESLIEGYNLADKVKLPGYVKNIHQFLAAIDLFVLPSLTEGLPISLLEAMAAGKPVVTSSVGGIPEVMLNSEQGMLIPPGDTVAIASAITFLLRQPEKMKSMGTAGGAAVRRRFSAELMAQKYINLYSSMDYAS